MGRPRLMHVSGAGLAGGTDDVAGLLVLAAALQGGSEHPLARAVVAHAQAQGLPSIQPEQVRAVAGRGTEGVVEGRTLLLGSLRWMDELGLPAGPWQAQAQAWQSQGCTVSMMAERVDGEVKGLLAMAFGDEPKPGAAQALAALKARGLRIVMVSGDNRGAAEAMARRLGLDPAAGEVEGEVLPADKGCLLYTSPSPRDS